jgi:hypothetical protein
MFQNCAKGNTVVKICLWLFTCGLYSNKADEVGGGQND